MDGDPAVEPELDSFSLTFPLPYRVAFIIVFAVWAWGANLHYLYRVKIDVPALIRYPGRSSPHHPPHHLSTYRLATILSAVYAFSLLNLSNAGRGRFLTTLKRVSVGGIAEAKDGKFGDILLADVLTSYARVFGDLYVAMCMFFRTDGSATARPDRNCGGAFFVPFIMAIPSMIRLRQCLIEYGRVARGPQTAATGWGGQHLANALKYFTAFPVITLAALQRNLGPSPGLYRAWVCACLVNSLYSFYWDVAKDWDLTLFNNAHQRNAPDQPFGLRRRLVVGPPILYYAVIALDLTLRCTWTLKLSAHLDHISDFESSLFVIEFLEVLRRWIWIFFRVETEWVRNQVTLGVAPDDILLGDYHFKDDDEDDD
ncbi:EXS-domain-containing protein [Apiospora hydei]|uniref:EXS-domain-containing protein n=1 Tax=Apiospora hydei TaxID=1337664 RepID=A0ABR1X2Z1_9PEZI